MAGFDEGFCFCEGVCEIGASGSSNRFGGNVELGVIGIAVEM